MTFSNHPLTENAQSIFLSLPSGLVKYRFLMHSGKDSTNREVVLFYPQSSALTSLMGGGSLSPLRQKRH